MDGLGANEKTSKTSQSVSQTLSSDEDRMRGEHGSLVVTPCTPEPLWQTALIGCRAEPGDIPEEDSFSMVGEGAGPPPFCL